MTEGELLLERSIRDCAAKLARRIEEELFDLLQREKADIIAATRDGTRLPDNYWQPRHETYRRLQAARALAGENT